MSNIKILNAAVVTGVVLAAVGLTRVSQAETLKVCYDQWPPMTMFPSEGATDRGVVIDMLEQIYGAQGYRLEYYEVPLARGLDMVADGFCDLLPEYPEDDASQRPDRGFVYANERTFAYATAFVIRRGDPWRYDGIESIEGRRIATGPGWDYSAMSVDYQGYIDDPENADLVEVVAGDNDVVERIFRMIRDQRVDLYNDNDLVLQHTLNRLDLSDELEIVRPGLEQRLVEVPIFSKQIPAERRRRLIRIWDKGRLAMKGSREQLLLRKYRVSLTE